MISFDANLLLYASVKDSPWNRAASDFLKDLSLRSDVVLSELVLMEFYSGLRNPEILREPLSSEDAADLIGAYRKHPRWRIAGFPEKSKELHDSIWREAGRPGVSVTGVLDARLVFTLLHHGVKRFATVHTDRFPIYGFEKVWNPLEG
ncbi:PIN domain-containing protein [Leptospira wolffii]|uniref:PIN domain-containing protein n=1 Tax=Leptospira wolffii TaxID=409998 RepID=UPI0002E28FB7|nr:PIN domain-containing protein [Leptospira wolffii]EPG66256.1 PIN domain protein [Leptospira wolffii serovar Khorat str. Khorat-H2]